MKIQLKAVNRVGNNMLKYNYKLPALLFCTALFLTANLIETRAQEPLTIEKSKQIVDKIFSNMFGKIAIDNIEYGKVAFNTVENTIRAYDIRLSLPNENTLTYKSVLIKNYQEDILSGDYSMSALNLNDGRIKYSEDYIERMIDKQLQRQNRRKQYNQSQRRLQSPPFFPKEVLVGKIFYSGIKGSYKEHFLEVEEATIADVDTFPTAPFDLSKLKGTMTKLKVTRLDVMTDLSLKMQNIETFDPENPETFIKLMATIYENISFAKFSITGLPEFPGKKRDQMFKVGEISASNLNNGILEDISIHNMIIDAPYDKKFTSGQMGRISLKNLNISDFIRLSVKLGKNKGQKPDPKEVAKMFQYIGGFSFQSIDLKGPENSFNGSFDFNWGKFVGLFPTKLSLGGSLLANIPEKSVKGKREEYFENPNDFPSLMRKAGIDKLDMKFDFSVRWDEKKERIVISPFLYDVDKMFKLNMTAVIGNIPKQLLLEQEPQIMGIMAMGANVGTLSLELTDKGIQRLYEAQGKQTWNSLSQLYATDPNLGPIIDKFNKFLREPNGTFRLVLSPKSNVNISQLATMAMLDPAAIFTLFNVEATLSTVH